MSERKFYEQRAINLEERQIHSFEHSVEMSRNASVRDEKYANQQFQLGENVLSHSSGILTQQIQNIEKLGAVIDLVRKTFQLQHEREEKQINVAAQLDETNKLLDQFKNDYQKKYADAAKLILNFKDVKAMEWPSLQDEAQNIATRARSKFEDVSSFVLQEEKKKNPYIFAKVHQLIGISAYYSNDIALAFDHLHEADSIYQSNPPRPEDTMSRAYTKHFLGIAEKNWQLEDSATGSNIEVAQRHLSEAFEVVKEEKRQFLIPVTLAEVLSYRPEQQQKASKLIDTILNRFGEITKSETLDGNQRSLLVRLYLLKGNLALKASLTKEASDSYKQASSEDSNSPFAHLSLAHSLPLENLPIAKEHWEKGLQLLDHSGSTKKREITTRVTALVWAVIAAHNCNDAATKEKYFKGLESTGKNIHSIANRVPLFFSPLSKDIVKFAELKNDLLRYLERREGRP